MQLFKYVIAVLILCGIPDIILFRLFYKWRNKTLKSLQWTSVIILLVVFSFAMIARYFTVSMVPMLAFGFVVMDGSGCLFGTVSGGTLSWIDFDGGGNVVPVTIADRQSGLDQPAAGILAYGHNRTLVVKYAEGLALDLFDLSGRHLKHVDEALEEEVMDGIDPGLYLLYIEGHGSRKVVVK